MAAKQKCPVCDWEIKDAGQKVKVNDVTLTVCCDDCANEVKRNPAKYAPAS